MPSQQSWFTRFAKKVARLTGSPAAFAAAVGVVLLWALSGPIFGYSDTWQLTINTGTTIVTFLMVFLIQNTQNRDSEATQVKLDELIRAVEGAHNALLDLEELDDAELDRIRATYQDLAERARKGLKQGRADTAADELEEEAEHAERMKRAATEAKREKHQRNAPRGGH